jgi:hypothetical protein
MTFEGKWAGCGIEPGGFETFRYALQQANLFTPKQREQMFDVGRKEPESHLGGISDGNPASESAVQDQNVPGDEPVFCRAGREYPRTSLGEDKGKVRPLVSPMLGTFETNQPKGKVIL